MSFVLSERQSGILAAFRGENAPVETVPVLSERHPQPHWAPPHDLELDGTFMLGCLDRAVTEALEELESLITKSNDDILPDNPRIAGAELLYAIAESGMDPAQRLLMLRGIARGLVRAHTVLILPHRPCGAYQDQFGNGHPLAPRVEWDMHGMYVSLAARFLLNGFYQLTGRTGLHVAEMHIDGNRLAEQPTIVRRFVPELVAA